MDVGRPVAQSIIKEREVCIWNEEGQRVKKPVFNFPEIC